VARVAQQSRLIIEHGADIALPELRHAKGSARENRELVPLSPVALTDLKKQGICYDREQRNPV
jgi:hypothetical protein